MVGVVLPLTAHESTHVSGGTDEIDAPLALAGIPTITQLVHAAFGNVTMGTTAWYDGASVTLTTHATDVLIVASMQSKNVNVSTWQKFRINVDGASYSQEYYIEEAIAGKQQVGAIVHLASLTASAHTIKVQGYPEAPTGYMEKSDIIVLEVRK